MKEQRGPWYLLTGLLIGIACGVLYTWVLNPVRFTDTSPDHLAAPFKEHYRSLIALAYQSNGDLGRARGRLDLLNDERPGYEVGVQVERILAQGGSPQEARALADLAADLGEPAPTVEPAAADFAAGSAPKPVDSQGAAPEPVQPTLAVTLTPAANANAAFVLKNREPLCDPAVKDGLLQVDVIDASGRPVPGVRITISWEGGEEAFVTGLYPKISPGYADFVMQPGVEYSLRAGSGAVVSELSTQECPVEIGKNRPGGWRLFFVEE